jgi:ABC-type multidrug transport system fused ATPase/permease subunit
MTHAYAPMTTKIPETELSVPETELSAEGDPFSPSVIQFTCAMYFAQEGEETEMEVDVARLGDTSGTAAFRYRTQDGSAKCGHNYSAMAGIIEFQPGEDTQTIRIPLIPSRCWSATLEFTVRIEGVAGAQKGKYLDRCRVKVINTSCFPTNRFAKQFEEICSTPLAVQSEVSHMLEAIPGSSLLSELLRLCFSNRDIRWKIIRCGLLDQLHGLHYFLTLYLQMYLIDVVIAPRHVGGEEGRLLLMGIRTAARLLGGEDEDGSEEGIGFMLRSLIIPDDRLHTTMVVAALYVLPVIFLHISDFAKCYLGLKGSLRKMLQANMLRRFLDCNEEFHDSINSGELAMVMSRDVAEVVDFGIVRLMVIVRIIGKLCLALVFILAENRLAAIPLAVYPVILLCFLLCRENATVLVNKEKEKEQDHLMQVVLDSVTKYRLIADFMMRPFMVDTYETHIDEYHSKESSAEAVKTNNQYVAPWLTAILIGGYMVFGANPINTGGSLTVGAFLATINVFKELGAEQKEIYSECLEVQRSFGPLLTISYYMNLPSDLVARRKMNRLRREEGLKQRKNARLTCETNCTFPVDLVKIALVGVTFSYVQPSPMLHSLDMEFEQGQLHAICGPPNEGKATLLKLLGQIYLPQENKGFVFVPPHLRVLHMSLDKCLIHGSFLDNVLMNNTLEKAGGKDRVRRICEYVGFSQGMLSHLDKRKEDVEVTFSSFSLSDTTWSRLRLARAFTMNPEILVCHKPAVSFNEEEAEKIVLALLKHCDERGLELPEDQRQFRRPRTVFFTSSTRHGMNHAHHVYKLTAAGGLRLMHSSMIHFANSQDLD